LNLTIQRNKIQKFLTESDGNQRGVGFNRVKGRFAKGGPFLFIQGYKDEALFFESEEIKNNPMNVMRPLTIRIS
jgi:hypothetical protein